MYPTSRFIRIFRYKKNNMNYKRNFLKGMGSIYDIKGLNHFNSFYYYPTTFNAINRTWLNVGVHFNNAFTDYAKKQGIKKPCERRECVY